jgi:hypothetical protein
MGKAKRVKARRRRHRWLVISSVLVLVVAGAVAAFMTWSDEGIRTGSSRSRAPGDRYETLASDQLPSFAMGSPKVEEAYRYAAAHPEVLQYIPCFCGCQNVGHRHNGDCYVQERYEDGRIDFTSHAAT